MRFFKHKEKPKISVVIAFFNMRREAVRTLYSLTTAYQKEINTSEYEVIVLDSSSSEPLDAKWVCSIQDNFRYKYVKSRWPTPCEAMNTGIKISKASTVVCMIDGARILSPGVLSNMLMAMKIFKQPFTYTVSMHLGNKPQGQAMLEGYDQKAEDQLFKTINWEADGYQLFDISCLAGSSKDGFLNPIAESNCFAMSRKKLLQMGGFDEKFITSGGGLVNLDIFVRAMQLPELTPVELLGEASFHQFHGGVATNVVPEKHPWNDYVEEYKAIRGVDFSFSSSNQKPFYLGHIHESSRIFLNTKTKENNP